MDLPGSSAIVCDLDLGLAKEPFDPSPMLKLICIVGDGEGEKLAVSESGKACKRS